MSYGLGTVPGALIVAGRHGVDLRSTGDGNPGAWNALEQLGWRRAWPAFVIDGLKGVLAAILGWAILGFAPWERPEAARLDAWLPWVCVAAAMLGHAFPLPRPARGGKSVMTFCGGAIALVPYAGLPLLALFLAGIAAKRAGLAARAAVFAFPFAQAAATPLVQVGWSGALMTLIGLLFLVRSGDRRSA
ncbi:MAG: glycerol-3-phosphate acyltransferase [Solirubrobacteraceae bacterium]|nr:glycerol-3-phosphate acyltransferase [Solirubrobacteraceae bacterium]